MRHGVQTFWLVLSFLVMGGFLVVGCGGAKPAAKAVGGPNDRSAKSANGLGAATPLPIPADRPLRFGVWNIPKLGAHRGTEYEALAAVIDHDFDFLVLVGIAEVGSAAPGYRNVLASLGKDWRGWLTDDARPRRTSGAEYYAMVWRHPFVQPCADWQGLLFHPDEEGAQSAKSRGLFEREPAFACFEARTASGEVGMDWITAAYRAPSLKADKKAVQQEVRRLAEVFDLMSKAKEGERDLLIAGSFSLTDDEFPNGVAFSPAAIQRSAATAKDPAAAAGAVFDHIVLADAQACRELRSAVALSMQDVPSKRHVAEEVLATHVPILATFEASGPDDD